MPLAIEKVQHKVRDAGVGNVKVVLADAARTDLPEKSFDLAFVFGLRRPIGGISGIWVEIHRLLKLEGTLAVEGRLEPPSMLFSAVGHYGRIHVFSRTGAQAERERFRTKKSK